jgi:hypothetical protein
MSLRYETPKTLTAADMFLWWCKSKKRFRRHLKIKYSNTHSRDTVLVSTNGDELDWLRMHVLVLAEQIEKLEIADKDTSRFTLKTKEIYKKKREIYDANGRIKHLEQVDLNTEKEIMSEKKFKSIIYEFNTRAKDRLIYEGEVINMKQYLGFLYVQKIPRNDIRFGTKSSAMPNWGESRKYKQELIDQGIQIKDKDHPDGKNWIVYFDDEDYVKFSWTKKRGACRVKNHNFYSFSPSAGASGPKKELSKANKKNPLLKLIYTKQRIYYPVVHYKKGER